MSLALTNAIIPPCRIEQMIPARPAMWFKGM